MSLLAASQIASRNNPTWKEKTKMTVFDNLCAFARRFKTDESGEVTISRNHTTSECQQNFIKACR